MKWTTREKEIRKYIGNVGYQLIDMYFTKDRPMVKMVCPNNHVYEVTYKHFRKGGRCSVCKGVVRYELEDVRGYFNGYGYTLESKVYINNKGILDTKCPKGHSYSVCFTNFKNLQHRCPICTGHGKFNYTMVCEALKDYDYTLVSTTYQSSTEYIELMCPVGHTYTSTFTGFRRGNRCTRCKSSNGERKIRGLFIHYLKEGYTFQEQVRESYQGVTYYYDFEITDGVSRVFIEYDGVQHTIPQPQWDGAVGLKRQKERDTAKNELCQKRGIYLIRVPYYYSDKGIIERLSRYLTAEVPLEDIVVGEPRNPHIRAVARYYLTNSLQDTRGKFRTYNQYIDRSFREVYGKPKREYISRGLEMQEAVEFYKHNSIRDTTRKYDINTSTLLRKFKEVYGTSKRKYKEDGI